MAGLRARPQSLPGRLLGAVSASAAAVRRTRHRPWRRQAATHAGSAGAHPAADHRRLGPEPLTAEQRRDLLEIVEDRYEKGSLLITSQIPVARWHELIGDPTIGDAVLDRVVHRAHRIELKGPSLRKRHSVDAPAKCDGGASGG